MRVPKLLFTTENIFYLLALLILVSMGLHAVGLHHEHPHEIFGDGVQAAFHGEERKYWYAVLASLFASATLFFGASRRDATRVDQIHFAAYEKPASATSFPDPIRIALAQGVLHSRIYG